MNVIKGGRSAWLLGAVLFSAGLVIAIAYSRSRLTHRISGDGTAEFLYLTDQVALCRIKTPDFAIGIAHREAYPDYVNDTGDRVTTLLVHHVKRLQLFRSRSMITGEGYRPGQNTYAKPGAEWFIIEGNQIEWLPMDPTKMGRIPVAAPTAVAPSDFIRQHRLRQNPRWTKAE